VSSTDPTLELRANMVLILHRLNDLGGFEVSQEDRGPILDALLADVTEPAPDDGPER
jgi:hypothetical protein